MNHPPAPARRGTGRRTPVEPGATMLGAGEGFRARSWSSVTPAPAAVRVRSSSAARGWPPGQAGTGASRSSRGSGAASFDLASWWEDEPPTVEDAQRIDADLRHEQGGAAKPSPRLRAFASAVIDTCGDLTEDSSEEVPWTSPGYRSRDWVITTISWSRSQEVAPVLPALAEQHGVTAFDPQEGRVHHPAGGPVTAPAPKTPAASGYYTWADLHRQD